MNEELLRELQLNEDAIQAYENGYYDTHDLEAIEENLDEYKESIYNHFHLLPIGITRFSDCRLHDGTLVSIYNK